MKIFFKKLAVEEIEIMFLGRGKGDCGSKRMKLTVKGTFTNSVLLTINCFSYKKIRGHFDKFIREQFHEIQVHLKIYFNC